MGGTLRCWSGSVPFWTRQLHYMTFFFFEQNTLTRHIFSCFSALITISHVTLAQGVGARHTIHVSCACVSDLSSTLHFALFTVSPIFHFILLIFHFIFDVGRFGVNPPVRYRE